MVLDEDANHKTSSPLDESRIIRHHADLHDFKAGS